MCKKFMKFIFCFCLSLSFLLNNSFAKINIPADANLDNLVLMELENGVVVIELYPIKAPWTVYRIKLLVANKFYDGLTFHRAIKNFMVQTGDPTGTGTGGSQFGKMRAEINDLKHIKGACSMARGNELDSADSQFFIVTGDKVPHLDGQYTVWGKVIHGMDLIESIKTGTNENNGMVENPNKIVKMRLVQDMNFNYEGDTPEQIENRKNQRIAILQLLDELKTLNDQLNKENKENLSLLDRIFFLNSELE